MELISLNADRLPCMAQIVAAFILSRLSFRASAGLRMEPFKDRYNFCCVDSKSASSHWSGMMRGQVANPPAVTRRQWRCQCHRRGS